MRGKIMTAVLCVLATRVLAAPPADVFYIYSDKGAPTNHFVPSGWMGDFGDLKLDDGSRDGPHSGKTAIQWTYDAKAHQGANWVGCYWQSPPNNWGDKPGGFDLSKYKRLTFWARGAKGGERIATFKVGGLTGEHGDSDAAEMGPVSLSNEWTKYTLDLSDKNLATIVGGFAWSASRDDNLDGFVMYLDDIRFEK